jgi:hypothetical protein
MVRRTFLRLIGLAGLSATAFRHYLSAPVLSATVNGGTVTLSWTDAGDETGYRVYRGTSPTSLIQIASLPADTTTYEDTP